MYAHAAIYTFRARRLAAGLALLCTASAFCYGVFLLLAVERTASLAKETAQIQSTQSALSAMENKFLESERSLTPERAKELGFVMPTASSGIFVSSDAPVLTFNNVRE
jgi:hypothetical protein